MRKVSQQLGADRYDWCRNDGIRQESVASNNALVICNQGPYGAGGSRGIAGLKYQDFTFAVSRQCRGKAGLLIPAKTAGEIAGRFDRGLPVYNTVFYPNFGRVLKYREIRDFEIKFHFKRKASTFLEVNFCCYLS